MVCLVPKSKYFKVTKYPIPYGIKERANARINLGNKKESY
jgi:hypothetical protein